VGWGGGGGVGGWMIRKDSIIMIETVVVGGLADEALDGVHDGAELDFLLVLLEQFGELLLFFLSEEGEVLGRLARLQLEDLWLVDPLVPEFLQNAVGLIPHKVPGEWLGVLDEADVLLEGVLLELVDQFFLFLGVEEGHVVDLLLVGVDERDFVDLVLDQFVQEGVVVAEHHVLDGVRVRGRAVAGVALRLRPRLQLRPLVLRKVPHLVLQVGVRRNVLLDVRPHLVLPGLALPLVLVARLVAAHVARPRLGALARRRVLPLRLEEGRAHCELGGLGGLDLLVGDGFDVLLAVLLGLLGVGQLLLDHLVLVDVVPAAALGRVELRVVALLHPAVALAAPHARLAPALLDRLDLQREAPGVALLGQVLVVAGVAAVVLDVVRVGTVAAVVADSGNAYSSV
jgi:hypothetical protein